MKRGRRHGGLPHSRARAVTGHGRGVGEGCGGWGVGGRRGGAGRGEAGSWACIGALKQCSNTVWGGEKGAGTY